MPPEPLPEDQQGPVLPAMVSWARPPHQPRRDHKHPPRGRGPQREANAARRPRASSAAEGTEGAPARRDGPRREGPRRDFPKRNGPPRTPGAPQAEGQRGDAPRPPHGPRPEGQNAGAPRQDGPRKEGNFRKDGPRRDGPRREGPPRDRDSRRRPGNPDLP